MRACAWAETPGARPSRFRGPRAALAARRSADYVLAMAARRFPRTTAALETIFAFVAEFLAAEGIERERAFDLDLIVEELFTNMIKYSREGKDDIEVALAREAEGLRLTLRDFNVERFDVTGTPDVDISVPISERRAGGLGLHLVRRMADRFEYDYRDRVSTITVWKRL